MAKKKIEEEVELSPDTEQVEMPVRLGELPRNMEMDFKRNEELKAEKAPLINCLRNEKIIVRHINRQKGKITDPKHVLYGGMADDATRTYCVPMLRSGMLADVLTKQEKDYLEYVLGLEPNAMSIYNKDNNFWSTANPNGISSVTLTKQDNYLDLSIPSDYIKYKILLANKESIAASPTILQDMPRATYEFVLISDNETNKMDRIEMSTKMKCYKEFGKIEDNADILKLVIETVEGRPISNNTKLEVLQTKINSIIQTNGKLFLKVVDDPYLSTKVLINKAIDAGIIAKRGTYLYMRDTGDPLCGNDEEPTFNIAAKYLSAPKHQDLKFSIEAKLKE